MRFALGFDVCLLCINAVLMPVIFCGEYFGFRCMIATRADFEYLQWVVRPSLTETQNVISFYFVRKTLR